jgi:hypothetical protein
MIPHNDSIYMIPHTEHVPEAVIPSTTTVKAGYTGVIYTGLTKIPDTPQNRTGIICM